MHWYPPPVEARITTPRHRPRPWQTVAQIEAMYHGGTPGFTLTFNAIMAGETTSTEYTSAHGFYVNTARAGQLITRRHHPRILPAVD